VGLSALSARLFHKYPSGLDAEEAAIAAALVRAPNAPAARVAARACELLQAQRLAPAGGCAVVQARTQAALAPTQAERLDADAQLAPHLGRRLLAAWPDRAHPPARLPTTLDARLQRIARDTLRQHLAQLRDRHVEDGALIVIDNASGEVLAWVGSSGGLSQAADVDGVTALRQAGSTLKPFLYEIALEERWLTAASLLDDSPVGLPTAGGLYVPQNYDHGFKGLVSVRTALASSLNVPAVRALVMVTPERFAQRLLALGLPLTHNGDYYGYSLALGSAEVTLASLTNAYRALANGGRQTPWRAQAAPQPPNAKQVMDPAAAFVVADVLADREARVPTFGLDNALAARYWAAVKTGTSKDMRDNWCVGFTPRHTVGVWVGNASGAPMWDVSGTTGAAPIWRAVMDELNRSPIGGQRGAQRGGQPTPPDGLVATPVRFERQLEPPRTEWFLAGTAMSEVQLASPMGASASKIHSPADRTVLALDPDIPAAAQKLSLRPVAGVPKPWSWRMDGKRLGPAVPTMWPMWPGRHRLELVDAQAKVIETVRFEVRGARVK
jgi:penicillin-binding protein 1C